MPRTALSMVFFGGERPRGGVICDCGRGALISQDIVACPYKNEENQRFPPVFKYLAGNLYSSLLHRLSVMPRKTKKFDCFDRVTPSSDDHEAECNKSFSTPNLFCFFPSDYLYNL